MCGCPRGQSLGVLGVPWFLGLSDWAIPEDVQGGLCVIGLSMVPRFERLGNHRRFARRSVPLCECPRGPWAGSSFACRRVFAGAARNSRLRTRKRAKHPEPHNKLLALIGHGGLHKLMKWHSNLRNFAEAQGVDLDDMAQPSAWRHRGDGTDSIAARACAPACVACVGEGEKETERERER